MYDSRCGDLNLLTQSHCGDSPSFWGQNTKSPHNVNHPVLGCRLGLSVFFVCVCVCVCPCVRAGLKSTAAAFLVFTLTVTLVAYTATAMTMAISADQSVVALANIFMTIACVFMMVRDAATQTYKINGL